MTGAPVLTATLKGAYFHTGLTARFLSGFITGDRLERFKDGDFIHTSSVLREIEPNLFETRSGSVYRVETWAQGKDPASA